MSSNISKILLLFQRKTFNPILGKAHESAKGLAGPSHKAAVVVYGNDGQQFGLCPVMPTFLGIGIDTLISIV